MVLLPTDILRDRKSMPIVGCRLLNKYVMCTIELVLDVSVDDAALADSLVTQHYHFALHKRLDPMI